jgi:hypothetical protein
MLDSSPEAVLATTSTSLVPSSSVTVEVNVPSIATSTNVSPTDTWASTEVLPITLKLSTDTTPIPSSGSIMSRKNAPTASGVAVGVAVGSGVDVGVAVTGTAVGCFGGVTLVGTGRGVGFAFSGLSVSSTVAAPISPGSPTASLMTGLNRKPCRCRSTSDLSTSKSRLINVLKSLTISNVPTSLIVSLGPRRLSARRPFRLPLLEPKGEPVCTCQ